MYVGIIGGDAKNIEHLKLIDETFKFFGFIYLIKLWQIHDN